MKNYKESYYVCDECQQQTRADKETYIENEGFVNYYQCERCGYTVCLDCLYEHNQNHLKEAN